MNTTVADLMTRNPVSVRPQDSVQHAAQLMDDLNVGVLPVCDGMRLLGIVTDRDITVRATAVGLNPEVTPVDLVMSDRVRCCTLQQSADEVLQVMARVQIRRVPVLDDLGRLVGIVSLGDIAARGPAGALEALQTICTPSEPDRSGLAA